MCARAEEILDTNVSLLVFEGLTNSKIEYKNEVIPFNIREIFCLSFRDTFGSSTSSWTFLGRFFLMWITHLSIIFPSSFCKHFCKQIGSRFFCFSRPAIISHLFSRIAGFDLVFNLSFFTSFFVSYRSVVSVYGTQGTSTVKPRPGTPGKSFKHARELRFVLAFDRATSCPLPH